MPTHTIFTVIDRGAGKKPYWLAIGTAWTNKDGSFNIRLDALPTNGSLVMRERQARDEDPAS